jgi:hypothetical protein
VSVKGGKSVTLAMLKELIATVEQNEAEFGLFVSLADPTQPMIIEAAKAGFYTAANGIAYPRIQILTITELLEGHKRPAYIDYRQGEDNFKKAHREENSNHQDPLL